MQMGLRGSLGRKIDEARLNRALKNDRKQRESRQRTTYEIKKEQERIEELQYKRKLQRIKSKRRNLERVTGTGIRGAIERTAKTRRKIANRSVSFSRKASKSRLAAYEFAGLVAPPRANRVVKKRKKRKRQLVYIVR
jgi:hypothetical protein